MRGDWNIYLYLFYFLICGFNENVRGKIIRWSCEFY